MKKVLLLSVLLVALISCNNKEKDAVQALNTDWENTTKEVQRFSNDLNQGYTRWQVIKDTMSLPPGSLQRLDNATRTEVSALLKNRNDYGNNYIDLGREFNVFFKLWEQHTTRLDQLTPIVNNNQKTELDVTAEITSLQAEVTDANAKISKWTTDINDLKKKVEADYEQFVQKTATIR